jgi:hypothetical protein
MPEFMQSDRIKIVLAGKRFDRGRVRIEIPRSRDVVAVPEPQACALVAGLGLLAFALYWRRVSRPA